jgi:beta-lactam-binding protein with PASTA domain
MLFRIVSALAVVIATVALVGCGGAEQEAGTTPVPDLIGMNVPDAQALIESRGLRWAWAESVPPPSPLNNFYQTDTIVGYSPAVGEIELGSTVMLVPSSSHIYNPLG